MKKSQANERSKGKEKMQQILQLLPIIQRESQITAESRQMRADNCNKRKKLHEIDMCLKLLSVVPEGKVDFQSNAALAALKRADALYPGTMNTHCRQIYRLSFRMSRTITRAQCGFIKKAWRDSCY